MERVSRIWFTPQQKAELWERWKSGQCISSIARTLGRRNKSGVYRILALNGGIVPEPRRRRKQALRLDEREEISRGIAARRSIRRIAREIGRSPSTVSREIRRNWGSQGYRATRADRLAYERGLRPKPCRLALHRELRWRVGQKLSLKWSPEQISDWLKQQFPTGQNMQISHEAIYCRHRRDTFACSREIPRVSMSEYIPSLAPTGFDSPIIAITSRRGDFGTEILNPLAAAACAADRGQ